MIRFINGKKKILLHFLITLLNTLVKLIIVHFVDFGEAFLTVFLTMKSIGIGTIEGGGILEVLGTTSIS